MTFHTDPIDEHPALVDPYGEPSDPSEEVKPLSVVEHVDRATFGTSFENWREWLAWALVILVGALALYQQLSGRWLP